MNKKYDTIDLMFIAVIFFAIGCLVVANVDRPEKCNPVDLISKGVGQ